MKTEQLEEWQHHIPKEPVEKGKPGKSWCGEDIFRSEWLFTSLEHAADCLEQNTRVQPCPDCLLAVAKLFAKGTPDFSQEIAKKQAELTDQVAFETGVSRNDRCDDEACLDTL